MWNKNEANEIKYKPKWYESKTKEKKNFIKKNGDWKCPYCSNINFAFRSSCNRCQLSKQVKLTFSQNGNNMQNINNIINNNMNFQMNKIIQNNLLNNQNNNNIINQDNNNLKNLIYIN